MKFLVTMQEDEDGVFITECPAIPGRVSQDPSEVEAEVNTVDAIRECLAVSAEQGMRLMISTREVEVVV